MTDEDRSEFEGEESKPQGGMQRRVDAAIIETRRAGSAIKRGLEFFGRHPLIAGVLGILGIVGLFISIQGYRVDRNEARETTLQIEKVQKDVTTVEERMSAACSSPPCWSLSEIMQVTTIGRPKDLLDSKLPTAEFVKDNQYEYRVEGCRLYVEYRDRVVSYVSADLYRVEQTNAGEINRLPCPFSIPQIMYASSYSGVTNQDKYLKPSFPNFPNSNINVKVQDILKLYGTDVRISNACIACGNYADPYVELFIPGVHAGDFIDFYFFVHSSRFQSESADSQWEKMKLNLVSVGPTPEDTWDVQTTDHCQRDVYKEMMPLLEFYVERVGIGRGQREWGGPPVLFCE